MLNLGLGKCSHLAPNNPDQGSNLWLEHTVYYSIDPVRLLRSEDFDYAPITGNFPIRATVHYPGTGNFLPPWQRLCYLGGGLF